MTVEEAFEKMRLDQEELEEDILSWKEDIFEKIMEDDSEAYYIDINDLVEDRERDIEVYNEIKKLLEDSKKFVDRVGRD